MCASGWVRIAVEVPRGTVGHKDRQIQSKSKLIVSTPPSFDSTKVQQCTKYCLLMGDGVCTDTVLYCTYKFVVTAAAGERQETDDTHQNNGTYCTFSGST